MASSRRTSSGEANFDFPREATAATASFTLPAELRNEMVADPIPLVAAVFATIGNEDADLAHGQGPHEPGVVHGHFTRSTDQ